MKKIMVLALVILAMAALVGCTAAFFNVSTNEDNSVSVTAERAPKGSMGIGYLTVGEGEIAVLEPVTEGSGELQLRFFAGLLGTEDFPDEPALEETVSIGETAEFTLEPGEYSVGVAALGKIDGEALLRVQEAK